ncbi:MAG: hypothetical protein ACP5R2_08855 [Anaerolineae bacterium]
MSRRRSSLSQTTSYRGIARFWDIHDLAEYWEETRPHEFEVAYQVGVTYIALKSSLAAMLNEVARRREVSPEALLNAWVRDRLLDEITDLEADES